MGRAPISMTVAETEVRRTVRAMVGNRTKLLMMAAVALFVLGPVTALGLLFLPELGEQAAAGTVSTEVATTVTEIVTGGVAVLWVSLVVMSILRTVTTVANVDEPAFLLLSTTVRNIIIGIVAAETALYASVLIPLAVLFAAAFAYGTGTVLPVLVAPLLVALLLLTAIPVGFVIGVWVRHLITVYEPVARYRTLLFAAFWLVYFSAIATGGLNVVMWSLFTTLQTSPLGWPGHLLLVGVPGIDPSMVGIAGAVAGSSLLVGVAFIAGIPSAQRHWFADSARTDDEEIDEKTSSDQLSGLLPGSVSRPVRTVAVTAVRRTKRAPIRLAYAGYPLLGVLGFIQQIIETGTVPSFMAVVFCLYVVWTTGVLFTLNPLGDLGPALPAVVTSTLTGRQAIRGRMLAGALVAVPLALLVSLAFGIVSPLSLKQATALAAGTVVGAVVTPALASGIGSAFPRFGSVNVTNNREAVMPSKTAFVVYTLAIVLPTIAALVIYLEAPETIAGLIASVAAWTPVPDISISARAITVGAWIVLIGGLIAPVVSYRYAIERFDWYALE
ncbi:hypothetical protein [Natrinema versiforme]|uniref:ABC-2 type transport system permease protein n=1 Tax=Natrinema versiforme JCM 10478 TaxID=1227496 RepID=L9Y2S4_9EURY|nr:hypothetical protein [Natrinema versiforme]ELY67976.1 hypothetical protein C489_08220 [Natrinema versiforme JCM 10478]